jgi:hypothetical protein
MGENGQVEFLKKHMAPQTSFPRRRESSLLHVGIRTNGHESQGGLAVLGGLAALGAVTPGFLLSQE